MRFVSSARFFFSVTSFLYPRKSNLVGVRIYDLRTSRLRIISFMDHWLISPLQFPHTPSGRNTGCFAEDAGTNLELVIASCRSAAVNALGASGCSGVRGVNGSKEPAQSGCRVELKWKWMHLGVVSVNELGSVTLNSLSYGSFPNSDNY